jgi:hypothetical protein
MHDWMQCWQQKLRNRSERSVDYLTVRNRKFICPGGRSGVCFVSVEEDDLKKLYLFLLAVSFLAFGAMRASAQSGTTYRDGPRLTCASDDGNRHYCAADTRYGVRMVNQRSGSPCRQGYSWGYDRRGIWVDRGCRADFVVRILAGPGPGGPPPPPPGYRPPAPGPGPGPGNVITCSSNNGGRNYCPTPTGRGVTMVRQRSDSPCRQGYSWGYDRGGIWVDRGCRADFAIR